MKKIVFGIFAAMLTFAFVSCGSTPKEEPSQVEEPNVTDSEENESDEPTIEVPGLKDNSDELSKTDAARQAALDAGADKVAPTQFAATEALYKAMQEQSKTGVDSSVGLKDLQDRYNALANYAAALDAKKKIDDNGFASYEQAKYDDGVNALSEMENIFSQSNILGSTMLSTSNKAKSSFDAVLFTAYRNLARTERTEAFKSKSDADRVKAGVSAKDAYNNAVSEFRAGDSSYSMQNPESAYNHYSNAKIEFNAVYTKVLAEREAAQKAMDEAKNKVLESASYAEKADVDSPLSGDNIQGIEAEDAKLLEDDTYEDPSAQEAEIPETIIDEEDAK